MADIYGSHFEYGGISSRTYDLVFANVSTSRYLNLAGTISGITVFNKSTQTRYLIDDDYSDFPVSFDIEIVTANASGISIANQRLIEKWLFNKHEYRKLYMDQTDDTDGVFSETVNGELKRLYMNCRFMNPERIDDGCNVIGYKATLEADSGLWWQDQVIYTYQIQSGDTHDPIVVPVDTDIGEYTYPELTIHMGQSGGDIILVNTTDSGSRLTKFVGLGSEATVIVKGDINYVSGQYYSKFEYMNFPRLLDGNNTFTITGDVSELVFKFRNRRML